MKRSPLARKKPLRPDPDRVREFQQRARASSRPKRRMISPASPAQRDKIKNATCLVTGDREHLTPAHVIDRSLGGCDSETCVVPLRADVHRAYDERRLDLLPYLEAHGLRAELAHAVEHVGLLSALCRITNCDWVPVEKVA